MGKDNLSQDRKAWERKQRENRIIDMAEPVFFAKGYELATIIEIAAACGYNKRSIYLYFRDKEELFLAVVLRGLSRLYESLEKASEHQSIRKIGRAYFDFSMAYPDYLKLIMIYEANTCVYQIDRVKKESLPGPFKGKCQEKTDAIARLITQNLETAISQGRIHTSLTPAQLMLLLWGQVIGVMQIIHMRQKGFESTYGISHQDLFDVFLQMVTQSLSQNHTGLRI